MEVNDQDVGNADPCDKCEMGPDMPDTPDESLEFQIQIKNESNVHGRESEDKKQAPPVYDEMDPCVEDGFHESTETSLLSEAYAGGCTGPLDIASQDSEFDFETAKVKREHSYESDLNCDPEPDTMYEGMFLSSPSKSDSACGEISESEDMEEQHDIAVDSLLVGNGLLKIEVDDPLHEATLADKNVSWYTITI
jgi:hypothetical protein